MPRTYDKETYVRKIEERFERKARQRVEQFARGSRYNPREPSEVWDRMAVLRAIRDHNAAVTRGEPRSWFTEYRHCSWCPVCQKQAAWFGNR